MFPVETAWIGRVSSKSSRAKPRARAISACSCQSSISPRISNFPCVITTRAGSPSWNSISTGSTPIPTSCLMLTQPFPFSGRGTTPSRARQFHVPTTGWPANGNSLDGVKMRKRRNTSSFSEARTKTVSDKFISRAICCIRSSLSPSASGKTASGLPQKARSVNTSS